MIHQSIREDPETYTKLYWLLPSLKQVSVCAGLCLFVPEALMNPEAGDALFGVVKVFVCSQ